MWRYLYLGARVRSAYEANPDAARRDADRVLSEADGCTMGARWVHDGCTMGARWMHDGCCRLVGAIRPLHKRRLEQLGWKTLVGAKIKPTFSCVGKLKGRTKMRWTLADTETTGIKVTDAVCEVAWRQITDDFQTVREGMSLINPGMPIHYAASAVNGITDAMVADAPTLDEYMRSAGDPLMGEDVVLICHNADFDYRYLKPHMHDEAQTLCTLKCARILYPNAENHKQGTLAAMLGITVPREKAHSADGDLDVLSQLLQRMCRDFDLTLEDLMEVQNRPRLITKIPFGKHKGTPLNDLPDDYVYWLLTKCENLDPDLRASLEAI